MHALFQDLISRYTPLYVASQKGHFEVVKILVEKAKVRLNTATERGATPLYVAAQRGHYVGLPNSFLYLSPLRTLQEIAKYLLEHGADCEITFQNGYTPLHIAVVENRDSVVQALLDHGANPLAKDAKDKVSFLSFLNIEFKNDELLSFDLDTS